MSETFERMVEITEDYLGPAARRFVARQVTFHLSKEPSEVTPEDIDTLTEWTRVTMSLLTEDQNVVNEYVEKMRQLSRQT